MKERLTKFIFLLGVMAALNVASKVIAAPKALHSPKISLNFYVTNQTQQKLYVSVSSDIPGIECLKSSKTVEFDSGVNKAFLGTLELGKSCHSFSGVVYVSAKAHPIYGQLYEGSFGPFSFKDNTNVTFAILSYDPHHPEKANVQVAWD